MCYAGPMTKTLNVKVGDDLYKDIQAIADEDYPDPKRRDLGNVSQLVREALKQFRDRHPRHARTASAPDDPDRSS